MKKKIFAIAMAAMMIMSMGAVAFADVTTAGGSGDTSVTVDISAPQFSVSVPTTVAFTVDANGKVTAPSAVDITNNSYGAVKVSGLTVAGKNGWKVVDYSTDMNAQKVGTKSLTLSVNTCESDGDNHIAFDATQFPKIDGKSAATGATAKTLAVTYDGNFAPQREAVNMEVATVTFTIGWDE